MRTSKKIFLLIIVLLLLPVWMWLAWLFTPKKRLVIAIVDKTVLTRNVQEHISLDWVLRHEKFTKTKTELYTPDKDYFGFFPGDSDQFQLKGLERFSSDKLKLLSQDADMVYFADTYGIYSNEWYKKVATTERSQLVYGGMTEQDLDLLTDMKERHKLMIAEFNAIGSPTAASVRHRFERLFGMHWSGWTGRYFSDLDTTRNKELPRWLIADYRAEHHGEWPFHRQGIAFVDNADKVVILEDSASLSNPMPIIERDTASGSLLDIPPSMKYPFWFDVIDSSGTENTSPAWFVIQANRNGQAELSANRIPSRFPAVLGHIGKDYRFYYFSGDFCDNPIWTGSCYFNGIALFDGLFYDKNNAEQRTGFFWRFYRPMMTGILNDYYRSLSRK